MVTNADLRSGDALDQFLWLVLAYVAVHVRPEPLEQRGEIAAR
jgi:hypothetical protein